MRLGWAKVWGVLRAAIVCLLVLSSGVMPGSTMARGPEPLAFASGPQQSAAPTGPLEGPHPFLTILCKFAGLPDEPEPPAFFERLLGPEHPGLDDYWQEVSYGRISLAGSKVVGWVTLPQGKDAYFQAGGKPDFLRLAQDCSRSGGIDADPGRYFGLNLVFNAGDGVPYGGRTCLDATELSDCYGTSWIWPPYLHNQATWVHEMGHSLGLGHTWRSGNRQYGDIWDVMSEDGACETDEEYGLLAQHPIAFQKDRMGWIPASAKLMLSGPGETTFKLAPLARPPAGAGSYLVAQIPIDGSSSHYYTVEARTRVGYDRSLLQDAVVIHEVEPAAQGESRARPRATLRWQSSSSENPEGGPFADVEHGIFVTVVQQADDGFTVTARTGALSDAPGGTVAEAEAIALESVRAAAASLATSAASAERLSSEGAFAIGRGRQHALWVEGAGAGSSSVRYATRMGGEEWGEPVTVAGGPGPRGMAVPALAAGKDGTVYAAWSQLQEDRWQVRLAVRADGAPGWSEPEVVSPSAGADAWAPVVAVDGRGALYVAWLARHKCSAFRVMSEVLLRVRGQGGEWGLVQRVDASPSLALTKDLRLIVDSAGRVYVEWQELGSDGTHDYLGFRLHDEPPAGAWHVARDERPGALPTTS